MSERDDVVEVVVRWATALDLRDWALARSCFADEIDADYGDLRGGGPERVSADVFVERRKVALTPLETLHQSTNHRVQIDGDGATCHSAFLIHRRAADGRTFDSAGHYLHTLARGATGWTIVAVSQRVLWSRGDPTVHTGARRDPK